MLVCDCNTTLTQDTLTATSEKKTEDQPPFLTDITYDISVHNSLTG